jgi:hypothetical protein
MASADAKKCKSEIVIMIKRFEKPKAFTIVPMSELSKIAKVMTTTWALKKKMNHELHARLNARGFEARGIDTLVTNPNTF